MFRFSVISRRNLTIGIRREAKNRWERRVPLVPDEIERLVFDYNTKVIVQPSTKRVIPDEKFIEVLIYNQAGAIIKEDLSDADIILGVKEVPPKDLIPNKSYMFFSHTHKGQPHGMPLLRELLKKNIELFDYELLTDSSGKRLVQFSRFAGYAGMVDGLHSLGHRLLAKGFGNPFLAIGMSYMYRCLADARLDVTRTGMVIADEGLPHKLGPLIVVITGKGNVAKGAIHVIKSLPHQWVKPNELEALVNSSDFASNKIYICQVTAEDYCVDKNGNFDLENYLSNPSEYKSIFHEKIAPYASMIVNGIFWSDEYPRLMTIEQTQKLMEENKLRLLTLADISCDLNGSFEFMSKSSSIDNPFFMYDPISKLTHSDIEGNGIQILSIDNLPTEMPLEASEFFSHQLFPIISEIAEGDFQSPVLRRARITTKNGSLDDNHKDLLEPLEMFGGISVTDNKKILLLGSGFVAKPLVDYLLRTPGYSITIASNSWEEASALAGGRSRTKVAPLDVNDSNSLYSMISDHDIVVSFVPATLHTMVAKICIELKVDMITASYISPAMQALDSEAKNAGITIMNEIGLDPGIDHLTACDMFDKVKSEGGQINSFVSWCGGLPAPEVSNNPLGYKFSWSPKGVLLAGTNSALYKKEGKEISINGSDLFAAAVDVPIFPGFAFEGLPNRNSLSYIKTYNLNPSIDTMFRGTLRYRGYSELMYMFSKLGFLSTNTRNELICGISWGKLYEILIGPGLQHQLAKQGLMASPDAIARFTSAVEWLGINSYQLEAAGGDNILDAFCALLKQKLAYKSNERDMVAMHHEFGIIKSDGTKETRSSTMITYGEVGSYSAMAKTVGYPAAMAVEMVLNGECKEKGVLSPMKKEIYQPLIEKLQKEGIRFIETVQVK